MADGNLGHLSVQIGLDIKPFLTNAVALKSQISRTAKLIGTLQERMNNGWGKGTANTLFKAQSSQLELLNKRYQYLTQSVKEAQDALSKGGGVDAQRQLVGRANNLSQTALQIDNLKQSMVTSYQQMVKYQSGWGQLSEKATNFGNKLTGVAEKVRNVGSWGGTMAVGGALTSAANKAMEFKSQIAQIGPLLSNTGRITSSIRGEMEQMSNASLKWSQQYGVSTTEINNSMMELIRRGFTTNQVMGSMPALLDAVKASGEDMNTVMQSSASVIEAFGLKADTAAQQTKNMRMVTDGLTYVANATASSYADLSTGLNYVGQTAAAAHVSFMDTAIALGIMSNKGVEASTAGTALRQMFTTLTKDTKVNRAHLKAIGLSFDEIKKKGIDLPDIIDRVSKALADKTPTEQMSLLNAAFGKTGQSAIALFQKSKAGSKSAAAEFREYQKEGNAAAGVTARIAKEMNNTPQAKWERFKQTLNAVAIEVGSNVLPALEPVVQGLGNMAKAFGKLDPSTQQAIVKFALFYAAIKPVTSFIAGPIEAIGKLSKGIGSLADTLGTLKAGSKASIWQKLFGGATEAAGGIKTAGTAAEVAGESASKSGGLFAKLAGVLKGTAPAAAEAAGGATVAGTSIAEMGAGASTAGAGLGALIPSVGALGSALLPIAGIALAAGAGIWAYSKYVYPAIDAQNKHYDSVKKWGAYVPPVVDKVATTYKEKTAEMSDALADTSKKTKDYNNQVKKSFEELASSAQQSLDKQTQALKKLGKEVGGSAGKYLQDEANSKKKSGSKYVDEIKQYAEIVDKTADFASSKNRKLNAEEQMLVQNLTSRSASAYVKTLNLTKNQTQQVLAAIDGSIKNTLSKDTANEINAKLVNNYSKYVDHINKGKQELKKALDEGVISKDQYDSAIAKQNKDFDNYQNRTAESFGRILKATGMGMDEIRKQFRFEFGKDGDRMFENFASGLKKAESESNRFLSETGKLSKAQKKAAQDWNDMILDPKTGEVRTNLSEFLKDQVNSKKGWEKLQYIRKNAKLTTNVKSEIAKAIFESNRWNSMSLKEKKATIVSDSGKGLFDSLNKIKEWNNLTPKVQEAIVTAKNKQELYDSINDLKTWNSLTADQKQIFIDNADAREKIRLTLMDLQNYDGLTPKEKKLIADASNANGNIEEALKKAGVWNQLPVGVKQLIADNSNAIQKSDEAKHHIDLYNGKKPVLKYFKGNSSSAQSESAKGRSAIDRYNGKTTRTKYLKVNSSSAVSGANQAVNALSSFVNGFKDNIVKTVSVVFGGIKGKHATGTPGAWLFNPNAYAYGTPNTGAQGGLAWVGDGGRKEVVFDSAMKAFYETPKTPTLVNLPRGSMVWRSVEQFEQAMRHAKLFANGTLGNSIVSLANQIPDDVSGAVKAMRAPSVNVDNSNLLELQEQNNELLATLIEQNQQMLQALMNLGFSFNVDGKQMANAQAENNSKAINEYLKRTGLRFS
ncbi:phage tail tape measure protein [Lactobacillus mulieris]|uniref:phage tail tape measure protein n=1 Tax=Lactobacillus mulieris TaxID=2508708 RepID=UPI0022ABD25E|nr:phage tail tape measure protein [Lactobacillus mulieris]MCZ3741089.1 phage tail tape measure protein [Lactobacillus mulieris]MCZ3744808.1 phage tail tape measure protein [Lactobacillus mulieris]MCZ3747927.1 phage tail tape measure protein [Lactobacillus mulieris]MCZ3749281.1 phage tail tape measure protein [Lactobacillus mulieris]